MGIGRRVDVVLLEGVRVTTAASVKLEVLTYDVHFVLRIFKGKV